MDLLIHRFAVSIRLPRAAPARPPPRVHGTGRAAAGRAESFNSGKNGYVPTQWTDSVRVRRIFGARSHASENQIEAFRLYCSY
jgi:hypothetical protein